MKLSTLVILAVIGVIIYRAWQNMKNAAIAGTQRRGTLGSNTDNDWVTNNPAPWQTPCNTNMSIGNPPAGDIGAPGVPGNILVKQPVLVPSGIQPQFIGPPILSGGAGGGDMAFRNTSQLTQ